MYDEKHRAACILSEAPHEIGVVQQGHRERLLCQKCDGNLGKYDEYACELSKRISSERDSEAQIMKIDVDYRILKLFQMSLLWRACIASNPPFSKVSMENQKEELRKRIFNRMPGPQHDFPCFMAVVQDTEQVAVDRIHAHTRKESGETRFFRFIFGGLMYEFCNDDNLNERRPLISQPCVQEDGTLVLVSISTAEAFGHERIPDYLRERAKRLFDK